MPRAGGAVAPEAWPWTIIDELRMVVRLIPYLDAVFEVVEVRYHDAATDQRRQTR